MLRFVFEIHAARSLTSFNSAFGLLRSICRDEVGREMDKIR